MTTKYTALLRDPRWQKKRLEILARDEFTCQNCFDGTSTLHVHHCYYARDRRPWEYEDDSLVSLCEHCHAIETKYLSEAKRLMLEAMSRNRLFARHYAELASSFASAGGPTDLLVSVLAHAVKDPDGRDAARGEYLRHARGRVLARNAPDE